MNSTASNLEIDDFAQDDFALRLNRSLDRAVNCGIQSALDHCFFEIEVAKQDVLSWLENQELWPKVYFQNREGSIEIAGVGAAITFQAETMSSTMKQLYNFLEDHPQRDLLTFIGGGQFDPTKNAKQLWEGFPGCAFLQPEVVLRRDEDEYKLIGYYNLLAPNSQSVIDKLFNGNEKRGSAFHTNPKRRDYPNYKEWEEQVNQVLSLIKEGKLKKAVLARATKLEFSNEVETLSVANTIKDLHRINPRSYSFLFSPEKDTNFISNTPERLCYLHGDQITCEALGGSSSLLENTSVGEEKAELFSDEKARREHQLVVDDLVSKLKTLCTQFNMPGNPEVLALSDVLHLRTVLSGKLKTGVTAKSVIEALHPTPAVCGEPANIARELIGNLENIPRGWYAGPIGLITSEEVELAVGIRSILSRGNEAHLFAGAGIVTGSDPATEWQELESKISAALRVLGAEVSQ